MSAVIAAVIAFVGWIALRNFPHLLDPRFMQIVAYVIGGIVALSSLFYALGSPVALGIAVKHKYLPSKMIAAYAFGLSVLFGCAFASGFVGPAWFSQRLVNQVVEVGLVLGSLFGDRWLQHYCDHRTAL